MWRAANSRRHHATADGRVSPSMIVLPPADNHRLPGSDPQKGRFSVSRRCLIAPRPRSSRRPARGTCTSARYGITIANTQNLSDLRRRPPTLGAARTQASRHQHAGTEVRRRPHLKPAAEKVGRWLCVYAGNHDHIPALMHVHFQLTPQHRMRQIADTR